MDSSLIVLLATGLSLGLLHAFDADHIMAVSSLSQNRRSVKTVVAFCARWALGHGMTLCVLASLFMLFNWQLHEQVLVWAERVVGCILIAVGLYLLYQFVRPAIDVSTHTHGDIKHTHLVHKAQAHEQHLPVLVGVIHGVAGSAPLLAFIPLMTHKAAGFAVLYTVLFSCGVLVSMLVFGILMGSAQRWLNIYSARIYRYTRSLLGLTAIGFGVYWLAASV